MKQLIQYKRFKEAAALLDACAEQQSYRLPRQPAAAPTSASAPNLRPVELWDLVSAFGRLMRETMALQPQEIIVDQTPLHVYMDMILRRLQQERRLSFGSLFTPPYTRSRLVGWFLAVLELTKARRITPEQEDPFSDIWLSLAPLTPTPLPDDGERGRGEGATPDPETVPATTAAAVPSPSAVRSESDAKT